jgi:hypothetical protein
MICSICGTSRRPKAIGFYDNRPMCRDAFRCGDEHPNSFLQRTNRGHSVKVLNQIEFEKAIAEDRQHPTNYQEYVVEHSMSKFGVGTPLTFRVYNMLLLEKLERYRLQENLNRQEAIVRLLEISLDHLGVEAKGLTEPEPEPEGITDEDLKF